MKTNEKINEMSKNFSLFKVFVFKRLNAACTKTNITFYGSRNQRVPSEEENLYTYREI